MNPLLTALSNKHTAGAGIAYALLKGLMQVLMIWFPDYHDKLSSTAEILEGLAVLYGLGAAGDATKSKAALDQLAKDTAASIKDGDTTRLIKSDIPPALLPISPGKGPANPS